MEFSKFPGAIRRSVKSWARKASILAKSSLLESVESKDRLAFNFNSALQFVISKCIRGIAIMDGRLPVLDILTKIHAALIKIAALY